MGIARCVLTFGKEWWPFHLETKVGLHLVTSVIITVVFILKQEPQVSFA